MQTVEVKEKTVYVWHWVNDKRLTVFKNIEDIDLFFIEICDEYSSWKQVNGRELQWREVWEKKLACKSLTYVETQINADLKKK